MDAKLFEDLRGVMRLAYKGDDRMDQDTLFELQEKIADIMCKYAKGDQMVTLVLEFAHIFKMEYK